MHTTLPAPSAYNETVFVDSITDSITDAWRHTLHLWTWTQTGTWIHMKGDTALCISGEMLVTQQLNKTHYGYNKHKVKLPECDRSCKRVIAMDHLEYPAHKVIHIDYFVQMTFTLLTNL